MKSVDGLNVTDFGGENDMRWPWQKRKSVFCINCIHVGLVNEEYHTMGRVIDSAPCRFGVAQVDYVTGKPYLAQSYKPCFIKNIDGKCKDYKARQRECKSLPSMNNPPPMPKCKPPRKEG